MINTQNTDFDCSVNSFFYENIDDQPRIKSNDILVTRSNFSGPMSFQQVNENLSIIPVSSDHSLTNVSKDSGLVSQVPDPNLFVEISEYLNLPQHVAAKKLGMPASSLSKCWKAATNNKKKWPYRKVCKIDKQIKILCLNAESNMSNETISTIRELLLIRNNLLARTFISKK